MIRRQLILVLGLVLAVITGGLLLLWQVDDSYRPPVEPPTVQMVP